MKTSGTRKIITILLVIVLLIAAVAAVMLLFSGGFNQLPVGQRHNPPATQNYASRQDAVPPPVDTELEKEYTAVSILLNTDRMREVAMKNMTGGKQTISAPPISPEQYINFAASEYVAGSVLTASIATNSADGINLVDKHLGGGTDRPVRYGPGAAEIQEFMLSLQGGKFEEFEGGQREISEGRMPEKINECIISEELAQASGLSVGNILFLNSYVQDADKNSKDINYKLTIVGIYQDLTSEYPTGASKNSFTNRRNEVLTTYETVTSPIPESYSGSYSGVKLAATYYLKDRKMLDSFTQEVYAKGLDSVYDVVYV